MPKLDEHDAMGLLVAMASPKPRTVKVIMHLKHHPRVHRKPAGASTLHPRRSKPRTIR